MALVLFRRPEETARVFEAIRVARPSKLFLIADGPRADHPDDEARCAAARAVVQNVDWDCEVARDYSDTNLGCGRRLPSGLDWVFEHVEEAIVLEDDCVPDQSFFPFCEHLLKRFRDDTRVMHINGNNFGMDTGAVDRYSYAFTHFPQAWGWATWRRAWQHFDGSMTTWPSFRDGGWMGSLPLTRALRRRQRKRWEYVLKHNSHTWDFQWHFAVMSQNGLAVAPAVNLVSNVGFGLDATHTMDPSSGRASLPTRSMEFPLRHPQFVRPHPETDRWYAQAMMGGSRVKNVLRRLVSNLSRDDA